MTIVQEEFGVGKMWAMVTGRCGVGVEVATFVENPCLPVLSDAEEGAASQAASSRMGRHMRHLHVSMGLYESVGAQAYTYVRTQIC